MKKNFYKYARKIRQLRIEMGMTQEELAEALAKHPKCASSAIRREAINQLEAGKRTTERPYTKLIKAMERIKENDQKM